MAAPSKERPRATVLYLAHVILSNSEALIFSIIGGAATVLAAYLPAKLASSERRYEDLEERVSSLESNQRYFKGFLDALSTQETEDPPVVDSDD